MYIFIILDRSSHDFEYIDNLIDAIFAFATGVVDTLTEMQCAIHQR